MILALLMWDAQAAPECSSPPLEMPMQMALRSHGHTFAGNAVVSLENDHYVLLALSPAGSELFTVSGPPHEVHSPFPQWLPWLERMPFERDLQLIFQNVSEPCIAAKGHIQQRSTPNGWKRKFRGKIGAATAIRVDNQVMLRDRRRGYRLTLVIPDAP